MAFKIKNFLRAFSLYTHFDQLFASRKKYSNANRSAAGLAKIDPNSQYITTQQLSGQKDAITIRIKNLNEACVNESINKCLKNYEEHKEHPVFKSSFADKNIEECLYKIAVPVMLLFNKENEKFSMDKFLNLFSNYLNECPCNSEQMEILKKQKEEASRAQKKNDRAHNFVYRHYLNNFIFFLDPERTVYEKFLECKNISAAEFFIFLRNFHLSYNYEDVILSSLLEKIKKFKEIRKTEIEKIIDELVDITFKSEDFQEMPEVNKMHRIICSFAGLINININNLSPEEAKIFGSIYFIKEESKNKFDKGLEYFFSKKILEIYLLLSLYKKDDISNRDKIQEILNFLIEKNFIHNSINVIINPAFELYFKYIIGLINSEINTNSAEIIESLMDLILKYLNERKKKNFQLNNQNNSDKKDKIMTGILINISNAVKDKIMTIGNKHQDFLKLLYSSLQKYKDKFKVNKSGHPVSTR